MKTVLVAICMLMLSGCVTREIQVEMISAELIRIDTVLRSTNLQKQLLTWRDSYNIEYVSFVPIEAAYVVGTRMPMLRSMR